MTKWSLPDELGLVEAAVLHDATFAEAARVLGESGLAAIAVLDGDRRVIRLFTQDDLLGGLFGESLIGLQHNAALEPSLDALLAQARHVAARPVHEHMTAAAPAEMGSSGAHLAGRFLHAESGALAVTDDGRFVGMVSQLDLCRSLMRRLRQATGRLRTGLGALRGGERIFRHATKIEGKTAGRASRRERSPSVCRRDRRAHRDTGSTRRLMGASAECQSGRR